MFSWITNPIINALGSVIWYIAVAPVLGIVYAFEKVFNIITHEFLNAIIFEGGKVSVDGVPKVFIYFVIACFIVALTFFLWNMSRGYIEGGVRLKTRFFLSLKYAGKSVCWILLIPFILVAMSLIYQFALTLLNYIFPGDQNLTLVDRIYQMACTAKANTPGLLDKNGNWIGATINPKFQEDKNYGISALMKYPTDWIFGTNWNILISIVAPIAAAYLFYKLTTGLLNDYIWISVLAIISPVPILMSVKDKGEKLNDWIDQIRRRFFNLIGTNLGFLFFVFFFQKVTEQKFLENLGVEGLTASLIQLACLMAIIKVSIKTKSLFANFWNLPHDSRDLTDSQNSFIQERSQSTPRQDLERLRNVTPYANRTAKLGIAAGKGLATTGIFGKGLKQSAKNSFAKGFANSKFGKGLNTLREGKSQALSMKANKLKMKANKIGSKNFKNEKQFNKNLKKVNKLNKKSDKRTTKANKLNNKVKNHKKLVKD